jgi:hypothetical protein
MYREDWNNEATEELDGDPTQEDDDYDGTNYLIGQMRVMRKCGERLNMGTWNGIIERATSMHFQMIQS